MSRWASRRKVVQMQSSVQNCRLQEAKEKEKTLKNQRLKFTWANQQFLLVIIIYCSSALTVKFGTGVAFVSCFFI